MKKVFIIEKDANILYGLQSKFSAGGFSAEADAGNSNIDELLLRIKNFQPTVIVLDLNLAMVDGFELIKEIRASEEVSEALIFIYNNENAKKAKEKGLNLGAHHYFSKDILNLDEFVDKVNHIMINNINRNK